MRTTRDQKRRALGLVRQWRAEGVPLMVTADEAWRLSGGLVGSQGVYETEVSLAHVALMVAGEADQ